MRIRLDKTKYCHRNSSHSCLYRQNFLAQLPQEHELWARTFFINLPDDPKILIIITREVVVKCLRVNFYSNYRVPPTACQFSRPTNKQLQVVSIWKFLTICLDQNLEKSEFVTIGRGGYFFVNNCLRLSGYHFKATRPLRNANFWF